MKFSQLQKLIKNQEKAEAKAMKGLQKRAEQIRKDMVKNNK